MDCKGRALQQGGAGLAHQYTDTRYCSQMDPRWYTLGRPYAAQARLLRPLARADRPLPERGWGFLALQRSVGMFGMPCHCAQCLASAGGPASDNAGAVRLSQTCGTPWTLAHRKQRPVISVSS